MSSTMSSIVSFSVFSFLFLLLPLLGFIVLVILLVRALLKNRSSSDTRAEQSELKRTLGEVLRECRTSRGMTQEFVAERLGVSRQAVSKWESGTSEPSTTNLLALAKLFDLPPEELLRQVDRRENGGE